MTRSVCRLAIILVTDWSEFVKIALLYDIDLNLQEHKSGCDVLTLSLLAATFFCQLIIFANSLDPDQDQQNLSPN